MAKAKVKTQTTKKIVLTLTEDEAHAVHSLVGYVSNHGPGRQATSKVWAALNEAGFTTTNRSDDFLPSRDTVISFKNDN